MNKHLGILQTVAKEKKLTLISTGMCEGDHINKLDNYFHARDCPHVMMHCVSAYPPCDTQCHMSIINSTTHNITGYSNHSDSIFPCIMAAAMGVEYMEVHITLDKSLYGSDQAMSFDQEDLIELNSELNRVRTYIGNWDVRENGPLSCEREAIKKLVYYG